MSLTKKQLIRIEETLKDFVCLLQRYEEVKNSPELLNIFLSRNRNPIFDLTVGKFWRTGLMSESCKTYQGKLVAEHYVPRKIAMGIIMEKLSENPSMSLDEFISILKKYSSTIYLTDIEHTKVNVMSKNTGKCGYEFYSECGIVVDGLDDVIKNL
jgi:hypothetical protein